jgi:hypothetical protein
MLYVAAPQRGRFAAPHSNGEIAEQQRLIAKLATFRVARGRHANNE